jgi:transcriptional regulator with PAS, ATPase and Fis domain
MASIRKFAAAAKGEPLAQSHAGEIVMHLSAEELDQIKPVTAALLENSGRIFTRWYEEHIATLDPCPRFSRIEVRNFFQRWHRDWVSALAQGNLPRYLEILREFGHSLALYRYSMAEMADLLNSLVKVEFEIIGPVVAAIECQGVIEQLIGTANMVLTQAFIQTQTGLTASSADPDQRGTSSVADFQANHFEGMAGVAPAMQELYRRVSAAAASLRTIFVIGESGTGKELVARAIHNRASDMTGPFVPVNCAAIPRDLIESELFGYRRGAFTGADKDSPGMCRAAEGGTLFLDEITEMRVDTQSKLLRVIQERTVKPIGDVREVPVNIRIIASTNRDPLKAIGAGILREDLYYRLQAATIRVPPLRERMQDLELLVEHFIERVSKHQSRAVPLRSIDPAALEAMRHFSWPGNVRELANVVESAYAFGTTDRISVEYVPVSPQTPPVATPQDSTKRTQIGLGERFSDLERAEILQALTTARGNKVEAARMLGISRKRLYARIAKYQLA